MKIVVIGGTGLIGSKVVLRLADDGHDAVAASPASGVDAVTGEGLDDVLGGAAVVVDLSNSPSFDDAAALSFFTTSTRNLLAAEATAGVGHHVALSVVGTRRDSEIGYFRAKAAQEELVEAGPIPWSLVHVTQFFEFLPRIADGAAADGTVRIPPVLLQPIAADDVAAAVARTAVGPPTRAVVEVAGPDRRRFDEFVELSLRARGDRRPVVADPHARYFGAEVGQRTLVPDDGALLGGTRFDDWLRRTASV
ncbi:SDR family oxidoreductase [Geodermatophilus sp. CPCC 206100]|uniref:SDR family oxidoreductase n=1 Tax=Geodermatophilus sp. CPCC 206100 TaxID=3020054 RepID=UPI003AFF902E